MLDHNPEDSAITSLYAVDDNYYLQCHLTQIHSCSKTLKLTASILETDIIRLQLEALLLTAETVRFFLGISEALFSNAISHTSLSNV